MIFQFTASIYESKLAAMNSSFAVIEANKELKDAYDALENRPSPFNNQGEVK